MSELFPLRPRPPAPPRVRLHCDACEVAWSGAADSPCWVCGETGETLRPILAGREGTVSELDLDLIR